MQLAGTQFNQRSAILVTTSAPCPTSPPRSGRRSARLPECPASQVHFSSHDIHTPGDRLNTLVAMNPAALKTNIKDLEPGGILIVNSDAFNTSDLQKAGYKSKPGCRTARLKGYRLFPIPITVLNREAVAT